MERGMDSVIEALRAERFPTDLRGLYYSVGDMLVENHEGKFIPVRNVLDRIERDRFETIDEAVRAIRNSIH